MRKFWIYIFLLLGFISCKENSTTVSQPKPCKLPPQITDSFNAPTVIGHQPGQLSPDGKKLLFSIDDYSLKVLDLKTLTVKKIDFQSNLPKNMNLISTSSNAVWCPYDNNRIIVQCAIEVDTVGDGKNYIYGMQLVDISIDGSNLNIVTPKECGNIGVDVIPIYAWLPTSSLGNDKLLILYNSSKSWRPFSIYYPQLQTFETPIYNQPTGAQFLDYSFDMKYITWMGGNKDTTKYYLDVNNKFYEFTFSESNIADIGIGSVSPNQKILLAGARVHNKSSMDSTNRFTEIWLINLEKYLQNPVSPVPIYKIINLKDKFCMYAPFASVGFISESTLVVSMYKGGYNVGDNFMYLYEIDLNGNMVRQLTFAP